ncbi:MAG: hypothetical protein HRU09_09525 [Oligoflexales bacterium]|nr:hypothetical protein [Oligoflexales bacterium]
MNITYKEGSPEEILSAIKEKLGGRKLGKMVTFELEGTDLAVTIKKMGTSHLSFKNYGNDSGVEWRLEKEKIALAHKAFKNEVLEKLTHVVEQTGGEIAEA